MPFDLGDDPPGLVPGSGLIAEACKVTPHVVRRPADGALEQMADAVLQHLVGGKADGVLEALGLQELVDFGRGEGGIGAEVASDRPVPVSGDHRLQHVAPLVGAVHVAGTKGAAFNVAEPIEHP